MSILNHEFRSSVGLHNKLFTYMFSVYVAKNLIAPLKPIL